MPESDLTVQESQERFRAFFSLSFDGLSISEHGRFVEINNQLARMLGYERDQMLGAELVNFIGAEDRQRVLKNIEAGQEVLTEHVMIRKDGSPIIVEAHGRTVEVRGRKLRFTTLRDITGKKRTEEALRHSKEELEHKVEERTACLRDTIAELEHFSYCIIHDMRAPLRAMQGYGELLVKEICAECVKPAATEYLQRIIAASERLDTLIIDSLDYSKIARGDLALEPVEVSVLLQEILDSYPDLQPDRVVIELEGNFPAVLGNRAALTQCFSSLLRNGAKFVAPGTRARVRVWSDRVDTQVRLWFEDNGIGVPPGWEERIFELFQRAHNGYPGTGVGLALVRKAVERMGGQAGVVSFPGKGSRFWLQLRPAEKASNKTELQPAAVSG